MSEALTREDLAIIARKFSERRFPQAEEIVAAMCEPRGAEPEDTWEIAAHQASEQREEQGA